ncbi:hypothetical protein T09_9798 [Trichinella sp. T9]|nr:hypothetical protein T09_9798 [Trichinella sp. T9]
MAECEGLYTVGCRERKLDAVAAKKEYYAILVVTAGTFQHTA